MKKQIFITLFSIATLATKAQMPYLVTTTTQAYTPLTTGATSVNNNNVWIEDKYVITMPFSFKIGKTTMTKLNLTEHASAVASTDTSGIADAFTILEGQLVDRGMGTNKSKSPIRYSVTGSTGSRIFKLEYFNAGFFEESANYSTLADSVNIQLWLYEGSNIVEFHYGPSKITHPTDYFFGAGPLPSYLVGINFITYDIQKIYYLKGTPASPTLDTTSFPFLSLPSSLNSYPANGTVYRYTPKTLAVKTISSMLQQVSVYPTVTGGVFHIDNNQSTALKYEVISSTGQLLEQNQIAGKDMVMVDISRYTSGMYLINISADNGAATYKVVKE